MTLWRTVAILSIIVATVQCTNWAILVNTSRYWFNYRHSENVIEMYSLLRSLGWQDEHILVLDSGMTPSDPRHPKSPVMRAHPEGTAASLETLTMGQQDLEVTAADFRSLLLGMTDPHSTSKRRFSPTSSSNVIVYITGHGGEKFIKFHDQHEMLVDDFAHTFRAMHGAGRYGRLLFLADTCKSGTLFDSIVGEKGETVPVDGIEIPAGHMSGALPGFVGIASASTGEDSYSMHHDTELGVALIDQFTYHLSQYVRERVTCGPAADRVTLGDLVYSGALRPISSTARYATTEVRPSASRLDEFFCPGVTWKPYTI